ncbi:MAG: hypothetical protein NUV55_10375 [Sulfuricaulis sp.]|uniref:hypothetical protein n=1 Tax=Sulfuricaulis sp. TaxID=2003553 RepID=UPI0025DB9CAA|nr:hypothetical protein [Sulfuricaulis sp.]MCR4347587.1 hypothetical protein [Sulfuricaulis sp.]
MKHALAFLTVFLAAISSTEAADDIDQINQLIQADFRKLSEDLGAALSYKAVIPATPLGLTGFDLGVEVTATKLENREAWNRASSSTAPDTLYIPKLHLHKGLPAGFDVGAFYTSVPGSNIKLWGAELRYAIIDGGTIAPALGLRGTYSKLSGVNQLDFHTKGLELLVSKGFTIFTPYAGAGQVRTVSEPVGVTNVSKEEFTQGKYFVGGNINLGLVNLAFEADKTGDAATYGAKLGFRF